MAASHRYGIYIHCSTRATACTSIHRCNKVNDGLCYDIMLCSHTSCWPEVWIFFCVFPAFAFPSGRQIMSHATAPDGDIQPPPPFLHRTDRVRKMRCTGVVIDQSGNNAPRSPVCARRHKSSMLRTCKACSKNVSTWPTSKAPLLSQPCCWLRRCIHACSSMTWQAAGPALAVDAACSEELPQFACLLCIHGCAHVPFAYLCCMSCGCFTAAEALGRDCRDQRGPHTITCAGI